MKYYQKENTQNYKCLVNINDREHRDNQIVDLFIDQRLFVKRVWKQALGWFMKMGWFMKKKKKFCVKLNIKPVKL